MSGQEVWTRQCQESEALTETLDDDNNDDLNIMLMCGGVCKSLDERALFESVCLFVTLYHQQEQQQVINKIENDALLWLEHLISAQGGDNAKARGKIAKNKFWSAETFLQLSKYAF